MQALSDIRRRYGKALLLLAGIIFFSANGLYFLEVPVSEATTVSDKCFNFDFDNLPDASRLKVNAKSALLVNYANGRVLYAKNADIPRPIASITKLVTAMVVLDHKIDLTRAETITSEDARNSSRSRLRAGYQLSVLDLLYAALLNSDNRAARALARTTCGNTELFVKEMNDKAKNLGLRNTVFYEPTGLDSRNVSTAQEVAIMLHHAYDYDLIRQITSEKSRVCRLLNKRNKYVRMANTNDIVGSKYRVLSGKTGYIQESGYCLTTMVQNGSGEKLTCVVLGVPGNNLRFREARRLVDWGFGRIGGVATASDSRSARRP
jgi:D-alanyl-D-alanine endopeptidase (penicillin-binding protein 7)